MSILSRSIYRFLANESGVGTVDGMLWTLSTFVVGSVSIDGSNAWRSQTHLQVSADAAALAGAAMLPLGNEAALKYAYDTAKMNLGDSVAKGLDFDDFQVGNFTFTTGFVAGKDPINAVQADLFRLNSRENAVGTLLMQLAGRQTWEMSARSIALNRSQTQGAPDCLGGTILSQAETYLGGGDMVENNVCVHGEKSLNVDAGGFFDATVAFSTAIEERFFLGSFSPNSVQEDEIKVIRSMPELTLTSASKIMDQIVELETYAANGTTYSYTDWQTTYGISVFEGVNSMPVIASTGTWNLTQADISPNSIYLHKGDINIQSGTHLENIVIYAEGTVRHHDVVATEVDPPKSGDELSATPSSSTPDQSVVAQANADGTISYLQSLIMGNALNLANKVNVGPDDICQIGAYDSFFFGKNNVSMGTTGQDFIAQGMMGVSTLGTLSSFGGIVSTGLFLESQDDLSLFDGVDVIGCDVSLTSPFDIDVYTSSASGIGSNLVQ